MRGGLWSPFWWLTLYSVYNLNRLWSCLLPYLYSSLLLVPLLYLSLSMFHFCISFSLFHFFISFTMKQKEIEKYSISLSLSPCSMSLSHPLFCFPLLYLTTVAQEPQGRGREWYKTSYTSVNSREGNKTCEIYNNKVCKDAGRALENTTRKTRRDKRMYLIERERDRREMTE